jgi:hypothetical protein
MRYLGRYYLVFEPLKTAIPAEVAAVADRLGLRFPDGYAEYVTELGEGTLSDYLRIWSPRAVQDGLEEYRRLLSDHFSWDRDGPLSPAHTGEVVMLGDTLDGDSLVFHPDRPDDLFVLPRHDDQIYRIGPGLEAAIDWLFDSGVLRRPRGLPYFEPTGERERIERSIPRPYEAVRDAVVGLGLHDHVAWEEPAEDEEKVFDVFIKVGDELEEIEEDEAAIMLLIRDIGGDVVVSTGPLFDSQSTDVSIQYVAGRDRTKLDRLLGLLDELESRGGKRRRRKK